MASSAERLIWRLVRPRYSPGLDGEGARLSGGRWNSAGRPAVYAASTLSLAVLEAFVHLPSAQRVPGALPSMRMICLSLPSTAVLTVEDDLGPGDMARTRAFGDRWIEEQRSLALEVPSVVVPVDCNVVLNPRHPDMKKIAIVSDRDFRFDPRLAASGGGR